MKNTQPVIKNDLNLGKFSFDTRHFCEQKKEFLEHRDCIEYVFGIKDRSLIRTCRLCPVGFALARTAHMPINDFSEEDLALAVANTENHRSIFREIQPSKPEKPEKQAPGFQKQAGGAMDDNRLLKELMKTRNNKPSKPKPRKKPPQPVAKLVISREMNPEDVSSDEARLKFIMQELDTGIEENASAPDTTVRSKPDPVKAAWKLPIKAEVSMLEEAIVEQAIPEPVPDFALLKAVVALVLDKYPNDRHYGIKHICAIANNNGYETVTCETLEADIGQARLTTRKAGKSMFLLNDEILVNFMEQ